MPSSPSSSPAAGGPSSAPSSVRSRSSSRRTARTPVIPSRQESLNSQTAHADQPHSLAASSSPTGTGGDNNGASSSSSGDASSLVGLGTVYSLGQVSARLKREESLKKKGSWDEEKALEEVLRDIGAGFDSGDSLLTGGLGLGSPPPRPPKKDKLLNVLGLPLPPSARPSDPSDPLASRSSSTTTQPHSSSLQPAPPPSLSRRPSSPNQPTHKLPPQPVRRPSLPVAPAAPSSGKGLSTAPSLPEKPQGFGHGRRTSLSLGFGINIHLGGGSTANLASPSGSNASPTASLHSPRVTFHSSSHPPASSSSPSVASSSRNPGSPLQSPLATSMSTFSFGNSSSNSTSSQPKQRRPLAGSVSSSSLREDPLATIPSGVASHVQTKVGKSGSKMDLAGFLGRRRNEGDGHLSARSVSIGGDGSVGAKSPSGFPIPSFLKQTFTSSSSTPSSTTLALISSPLSPKPTNNDLPADLISNLANTPAPAPPIPTTNMLASALRLERQLSPNPSALALAAADPSHDLFLADPPPKPKRELFPLCAPPNPPPISHHVTKVDVLDDHAWIEEWIRTGVGRPSEEMDRRAQQDRRRVPLWKGPVTASALPKDASARSKLNTKASMTSSAASSESEATTVAGGGRGGGESSGEESNATLLTPLTSSPVVDMTGVGLGLGMGTGTGLTSRRGKVEGGVVVDGRAYKGDAGVRINLVPASPGA